MNIKIVGKAFFTELCIMKSLLLPVLFLSVLALTSCSSEYAERLDKAKELKLELSKAIEDQERIGLDFNDEIAEIIKEIDFHAKVSGNEELFIQELNEGF